jgi:hypothetical protein
MKKSVILLRFCYWLGAILDAHAAWNLTLLRYREITSAVWAHQAAHDFGMKALWAAGDAYALMWGWTLLLIWADRKPVERRGVLLLTVVPVILLLDAQRLHLWLGGFLDFGQTGFWFFFLVALAALFTFSYFCASPKRVLQETGRESA